MFCEINMKRIKNARRYRIPESVGFGMWSVTNQNTRGGASVDLRRRRGEKGEGSAANFAQVRQGGYSAEPKFKGCVSEI